VRLSSFRGSKNVVLVFYPLAFSGVCSGELCTLRDEFPAVAPDSGTVLLTVSVDAMWAHRAWAEKEHFEFELLSDFWPHGAVSTKYGAFDDSLGAAGRKTYVIDPSGTIRWAIQTAIPNARDIDDYLKALANL
jgi:peroxiredoxin